MPNEAPQQKVTLPPGITCEQYVPSGEGKRCLHYVPNGTCALPDGFMCIEWLRANGHASRDVRALPVLAGDVPGGAAAGQLQVERDLFGNIVPPPAPTKPSVPVSFPVKPAATPAPSVEVTDLPGLTAADIESFRALGMEVRLRSETCGEVWLVPAYTAQQRLEIIPEHAALVLRVLAVFPGSQLVGFEKPAKPAPSQPKEPSP